MGFFTKKPRPLLDTLPPSGIFIRTPGGGLYFVRNGQALAVSEIAFSTWNARAIGVTEMAFRALEHGGRIGFRDGTLVRDFGDGTIYLISNSRKRQITDPRIYEQLGGDAECLVVPSEYLKIHKEGEPLANPENQ